LGDLVIPSLLVVSAAAFSPADTIDIAMLSVNLPAIGTSLGIIVGVVVLFQLRGSIHAGLPPLNSGALAGYAAGCLLVGVPMFPS
jgi:presenilin-like A22 family membrane protease